MSTSVAQPAWMFERPWRNNNPGDLRCLPTGKWDGQTGADDRAGGPFAIFVSRRMGWRALAVCLLTYFERHGLNTIDGIIDRYAPPVENNTEGYKQLVCSQLGVTQAAVIDPREPDVMLALVSAIAVAEGGSRVLWPADEKLAGVQLALGITPAAPKVA